MKLLKKIVLLSTLFITIFCISSKYYLKDKEKQVEAVSAAVEIEDIFYWYYDFDYIFLGTEQGSYYANYSISYDVAFNKVLNKAILRYINVETTIFNYDWVADTTRDIYYDDVVLDYSYLELDLITEVLDKGFENMYVSVYFYPTDYMTHAIEYEFEFGEHIFVGYPNNEYVEMGQTNVFDSYLITKIDNPLSQKLIEYNYSLGESTGYENGYSEGEEIGFENGYKKGFDDGEKALDFTFLSKIFEQAKSFFDMEIFPGFKLVYLIAGPLIIALIVGVLKFLR